MRTDYQVSYKRMYKSASSTIVDLLGAHSRDSEAKFTKRFTVIGIQWTGQRVFYKGKWKARAAGYARDS